LATAEETTAGYGNPVPARTHGSMPDLNRHMR